MYKTIGPAIYIEGSNVITKAIPVLKRWGCRGIILGERRLFEKFTKEINPFLKKLSLTKEFFNGECAKHEIDRIVKICKNKKYNYIIGFGGGKALDTAKAVSFYINKPCLTIPTSSATSAASTALSALYTENGVSSYYLELPASPACVVVDFNLIINAPQRYIASGMADALAKYYESMAFTGAVSKDLFVNIALQIAERIHNTIFTIGKGAYNDAGSGRCSEAFKEIVRINILLAGVVGGFGGEGCRACAAHAVNNGFTRVPAMRRFLHGEMVGYGNILQLKLENKNSEIKKLKKLYKALSLPYSFESFQVEMNDNQKENVIKHICSRKETLKNMPRRISKDEIEKILFNL
ncbi:MAG: iron-containing alcohol dehydrogenase [Elusimicrobiota bacterium]